jgi:hypothetical protein
LADKAAGRRSQRGANRDFPLARGAARQLQAGKIHAGNQQDQTHGREQHQQLGPYVAEDRVLEGEQAPMDIREITSGIVLGIMESEPLVDDSHFGACLRD